MPVTLAGITLARVHRLHTLERADYVYHRVPGLEGELAQDMGRRSVRLTLEGILYGPAATDDLQSLRDLYLSREPTDLLAEIVGESYFGQVTLDSLEVTQSAGAPDEFELRVRMVEYVPPPEPVGPDLAGLDAGLLAEATSFLDLATLPDLLALGSIPEVTNPLEPLGGALDSVTQATEGLGAVADGLKGLFGVG